MIAVELKMFGSWRVVTTCKTLADARILVAERVIATSRGSFPRRFVNQATGEALSWEAAAKGAVFA